MNPKPTDLPTLTEVIDIGPLPQAGKPAAAPAPAPHAPVQSSDQALAYDEELVAQVMVRLQPRLEAWVEAQVRRALTEMLPVWAESASLSIVRDLRSEMPELLSLALDEVHRQRPG